MNRKGFFFLFGIILTIVCHTTYNKITNEIPKKDKKKLRNYPEIVVKKHR